MVALPAPRIELHGVSREFGAVTAVRNLNLTLEPGRMHAIIGENGAGKSTVLKVIAGLLVPSAGTVTVNGESLPVGSPAASLARGIGMVHQHFMLFEPFTALENVMLGAEPVRHSVLARVPVLGWLARHGTLDLKAARTKAQALAAEAGLEVDLDARVATLSVGEKQRLEILRILYRGARALLLDEPTAVLSPIEVSELYATLRRLVERGHTIAVVTHRLDEVARFADEVTAMRHGERVLGERLQPDVKAAAVELIPRLTRAVMGGEVPAITLKSALAVAAETVLELQNVSVAGVGAKRLHAVSMSVRSGEIVGLAGIEGNGQRELATALAGLSPLSAGVILLDGSTPFGGQRDGASRVREARSRGLVTVLDDRHHDELLLEATVGDNLVLGDLDQVAERAARERRMLRFAVEPSDPSGLARHLSGGNQQKLVMARALDRKLRALVLGQPTRGVDVGTARIIHDAIIAVAAAGAALVVISADLNELRQLCHRILVLREGRIVAEFPPSASDETMGRAMLGVAGSMDSLEGSA